MFPCLSLRRNLKNKNRCYFINFSSVCSMELIDLRNSSCITVCGTIYTIYDNII